MLHRLCLLGFCFLPICFCYQQTAYGQTPPRKQLTIEAIFAPGSITGRTPEGLRWTPDQKSFSYIQRDDSGEHAQLWLVDATTGEAKVLIGEAKLAKLAPSIESIKDDRQKDQITRHHVAPYYWTPDSKHLLFTPHGQLWLYDLQAGTAVEISPSSDPVRDPKFSSDGKRLAYVREHNLYVQMLNQRFPKQLTRSNGSGGEKNDANILSGEVDWVYAEELAVRSNYFWSPDNSRIAFLQMDEAKVPTYPISDWMPVHPTVDYQKYPKAGDPNPVVRLGLVNSNGANPQWISLTDDTDIYIPRFGWLNRNTLWAEVLNRHQDTMDLYFIDAGSRKSRKVLTESAPDSWVKVNDDFTVMESKGEFLWTSWRDGHTNIYLYSYDKNSPLAADAKLERRLTSGDFEVLGIQSVDMENGIVFFNCNKDDPRQQQIYSVKIDGSGLRRISMEDGFHDPTFSGNGAAYLDNYSALLTPNRFSICRTSGECRPFAELKSVKDFGLTEPKELTFKGENGTTLYGRLLLPPNATPREKIPVIVNIYGGPGAQVVVDEWSRWAGASPLFAQILARDGFAVFSVDNRGTPGRSRTFQTAIRHQYGDIELRDQLTSLDQLFAEYPQLDRDSVGIWGWSNGGSMTLYALTHSERFRAGASVAPVTDWHDYDSIYTERYLGLPADDPNVYENPIAKFADRLHGALLLAHGTEDDNVHLQNSVQMIDALIRGGKQFRFMAYPNKTHGIEGPEYRIHLFHMIEDHFERELKTKQ